MPLIKKEKKVLKEKKEPKLRVDSENWNLTEEDLTLKKQLNDNLKKIV
mgnify:CR=1 FL=1